MASTREGRASVMDGYTRIADDIDVAYMHDCVWFTVEDMMELGAWER